MALAAEMWSRSGRRLLAPAREKKLDATILSGGSTAMSVAKITEISAESSKSFEDALQMGIARAAKTIEQIKGAWVNEQSVVVENGKITSYRVNLKLTFVLKD
jgi:flavin-binding protein dodecin